ncbi:uncharacterized protein LOC143451256 isoform X3 [Clavelina lepadiformis]|uniref:uncharacterized protein LOC143451256 isoform X3 n=1 Tax=Clavelina lepadiformis TaxID=159417 RepID=UPI004040EE7D
MAVQSEMTEMNCCTKSVSLREDAKIDYIALSGWRVNSSKSANCDLKFLTLSVFLDNLEKCKFCAGVSVPMEIVKIQRSINCYPAIIRSSKCKCIGTEPFSMVAVN